MAKFGSSSMARWWYGRAAVRLSAPQPRLYAFRASSEGVVACGSGTSNFCTVASDSPSSPRSLDAASPNVSSTFSLAAAVTCSCASVFPFPNLPAPAPDTLGHGAVVIAAITSCTNTSNPSVLLAAGLVAKKAGERGVKGNPLVKASLAPGSPVVTEYRSEEHT